MKKNPYIVSIGVLAAALVVIGFLVMMSEAPKYGTGEITDGQIIGASIMGFGIWFGLAYLVVKAILWRPPQATT